MLSLPENGGGTTPPPKIVLFLPSLEGGGVEGVFVQLANEFVRLGYNVDFALANAVGPYIDELHSEVRLIDLDASGVLRAIPKLARYLREERPEVLLSALDHANIVVVLARMASRSRTRCVLSIRSVPTAVYGTRRTLHRMMMLVLMASTFRLADGMIANSKAVAKDLTRTLRLSKRRMQVIYNPVNTDVIDSLSREAVPHAWYADSEPPVILSIGSFSVLKDFPTLIRAFSLVRADRECRLVILGEGSDRPKLESLVDSLGLHGDVCLPGFVKNPFPWIRNAALFVSSSLTEGCPNALMQALACGTPVVSTDCEGGSAEILEHGKWGRLVPVGDASGMAESIIATLGSIGHVDGRERASAFSIEGIAQQYLRVLLPYHFSSAPGN